MPQQRGNNKAFSHEREDHQTISPRSSKKAWDQTGPLDHQSFVAQGDDPNLQRAVEGHISWERSDRHCGALRGSVAGDFIFTVNYTDAATYWGAQRAQWNKGMASTAESLMHIRTTLPFTMLGLHPDTGSEFINRVLKTWCDKEGISLTRSEPGKKNDNMYVEERNGHIVRRYLGYLRFDVPEIVTHMNALYDVLDLYLNHFKAVRRQVSKDKVGSKYIRRYEKVALTPYARVLAHPDISNETKELLKKEHETLHLLKMKKEIATITAKIYSLQRTARERVIG